MWAKPAASAYNGNEYPRPMGDFIRVDLPIRKVGNLIVVEAEVDSIKGDFILDTGSPYLILNGRYFSGYKFEEDKVAHDITGRKEQVRSGFVRTLRMGPVFYQDVAADLADLSAVEELRGVKILGALGVSLFLELELEINLAASRLSLHRLDASGVRLPGDFDTPHETISYRLPFELRDNVMLVKAEVAGHPLSFCFDTGAEAVVLGTGLDPRIYKSVQLAGCLELTGANGSSCYVHYGKLSGLRCGRAFENVNVIVANLKGLKRSYGNIHGIVGYDVLADDVIAINFQRREISFKTIEESVN